MSALNMKMRGGSAMAAKFKQVAAKFPDRVIGPFYKRLGVILTQAKRYCPVAPDGGTLRSSGYASRPVRVGRKITGEIGFGGAACVFGSETKVVTPAGPTPIGRVQVGDSVLTQSGDFRKVLAKSIFPVGLKPDLVEVRATWRAGGEHNITLTSDHKVLAYRENRRLWVPASELKLTDKLFQRIKIAPNVGRSIAVAKFSCSQCGNVFTGWRGRVRRYCSMACRNIAYAGIAHPSRGKHRSAESMANARRALAIKRWHGGSAEQQAVERWLIRVGVTYEKEVAIGGYFVDFYIPDEHLIIEADGAYWHQNQEKDVARDVVLIGASLPGLRIWHVHFFHEKCSPKLNENPLPNVTYVACNPGPETFVAPDIFEQTDITSLRSWRHDRPAYNANLYDLSVEGIHSFVASGLIISNSDYAIAVHEHPSEHDPPSWKGVAVQWNVGGPQFLARAIHEAQPTLLSDIASDMRAEGALAP